MVHPPLSMLIPISYLWEDGISDLRFWWELAQVSHDIGNFLLLNEVLLLVVEETEGLIDFGFEVLLSFGLLGHRNILIPEHLFQFN